MVVFGGGLFLILFLAICLAGPVFWIVAIVDVAKTPEPQFRAALTEKITWVLIVVLAGWIGGLIWWFAKRPAVQAAGTWSPTPAGWYPDGTGGLRWWDGSQWTDHRASTPP